MIREGLFTLEKYRECVQKRIYDVYSCSNPQNYTYYIYGSGRGGVFVFNQLRKNFIHVNGFIDSNEFKCGTTEKETGLKIVGLDEVDKESRIIIGSLLAWSEIYEICRENGYVYCCNYEEIAFIDDRFEHSNPAFVDMAEGILDNQQRYREIYKKLSDKKSKEVLEHIVNFRLTLNIAYAEKAYTMSLESGKQYFDNDIISKNDDEVFVDCGGYKGETTEAFVEYMKNYKKIYFIEPDKMLIEEAKKNLESQANIEYLCCGVGKEETVLCFDAAGDQSGSFSDKGTEKIRVVAIDDIAKDKVTFIKMDIEGMEKEALLGAKKVISNFKPKLAISVYHKCTDIVDLAECVLQIRGDYQIYMRHYTKGCADTVMYFV